MRQRFPFYLMVLAVLAAWAGAAFQSTVDAPPPPTSVLWEEVFPSIVEVLYRLAPGPPPT